MKLPFFDFNDSYPLTLGVSDDYFTLSTRLKRLGRAPMQPRRRTAWLLSVALLVSFVAVVPLRLVSRAQEQKKPAPFGAKIIGGTVHDSSGNAVAGAEVIYRMAGSSIDNGLHSTLSDADGRFQLSLKWSAVPAQLWADAGELTTPHATIAVTGEAVDLQLQSNAWAAVSGRVIDAKEQAIADAKLTLYQNIDGNGVKTFSAISDANGQYNFQRLRPGLSANVTVAKKGYIANYALGNGRIETLETGQNRTQNLSMKRAASTLAGRVLEKSGVAARGFRVWAEGASDLAITDKSGNFKLPQVTSGHIQVSVTSPSGDRKWLYIPAQGGDQNVVIRLNRIQSYYYGKNGGEVMGPLSPMISDITAKLVGQEAPALQVIQWSGGVAVPLAALRGQKVLLAFDPTFYDTNQLHDFARSYAGRLAVMGIKTPLGTGTYPAMKQDAHTDKVVDQTARKMGFPIGVDTILPTNRGSDGRTFIAYGNAPYVVIGRDGKVIYAGKKLDRAIELATAK